MAWNPMHDPNALLKPGEAPTVEVFHDVYVLIKVPVYGTGEHVEKMMANLERTLEVRMGTKVKVARVNGNEAICPDNHV